MIQIYPETFHKPLRGVPFYAGDSDLTVSNVRFSDPQRVGPTVCLNPESSTFHLSEKWAANSYHWMHDILSCLVIRLFSEIDAPPIRAVTLCNDDQKISRLVQWVNILGIEQFSTGKLEVLDGNCHVEYDTRWSSLVHPEAVKLFRRFIPEPNPESPKMLLIQRNGGGAACNRSRNLENRESIISFFRMAGIELTMVFLECLTVRKQIELFSNADLIIAVHGAGLTNITFCKETCKVIEVASPVFYNESFANIASLIGLRFATVQGYGPMETCQYNQPVSVNPVILLSILNEMTV